MKEITVAAGKLILKLLNEHTWLFVSYRESKVLLSAFIWNQQELLFSSLNTANPSSVYKAHWICCFRNCFCRAVSHSIMCLVMFVLFHHIAMFTLSSCIIQRKQNHTIVNNVVSISKRQFSNVKLIRPSFHSGHFQLTLRKSNFIISNFLYLQTPFNTTISLQLHCTPHSCD